MQWPENATKGAKDSGSPQGRVYKIHATKILKWWLISDDIIWWSYHVFDLWCLLSIQGCAFPRWLVWISTMQICSKIDLLNVQRSPSFHIFVRSWLCPLLFPALAFCGRSETYLLLTASFRWTAKLLKAKLETSSKSKPWVFCCAHRSVFESYSYTMLYGYTELSPRSLQMVWMD